MGKKIKIDIVSDVVCPWCIIGYKRLEAAINELNLQDKIEIEWQPFELNSNMPKEGENLRDHVLRKYGASREDSDKARENIKNLAAEYGFSFNYFEEMKIVNTKKAHILLDYAHSKNLQHNLKIRLFHAFFGEQKDISDRDILINEASKIGINSSETLNALSDTNRIKKVESVMQSWLTKGVSGVPTIVFNNTNAITGAHPQATYKQILQELSLKD